MRPIRLTKPVNLTGFERNLNSSLPLGQVALKFCCPRQVFLGSSWQMACRSLAHWASENEKLLAQKENLLVLDDRTALFLNPESSLHTSLKARRFLGKRKLHLVVP